MKLFGRELTIKEIIGFCKYIANYNHDNGCSDCLAIAAANDLVAEIERQNEWIAVSDRLPDITQDDCSDDVLIAVKYATDCSDEAPTVCCGYYLDGQWYSYMEHNCNVIGSGWGKGDTVTYWKPLPEPPKVGT